LGLSFFDLHEIDIKKSTPERTHVFLKTDKKKKRKVLNYILKNDIPVSMLRYKFNDFDLKAFEIKITQLTCTKYIIDFDSSIKYSN
jgi:hypothetical protein